MSTGHHVLSFVTSEMTISLPTVNRSRLALGEITESNAIGCVAEFVMTDFTANGLLYCPTGCDTYQKSRRQYRCLG